MTQVANGDPEGVPVDDACRRGAPHRSGHDPDPGPVDRFPTRKHVVSYIGLAPAIASSAGKHRLGGIIKQGNTLLRYVLGQAGHTALRGDPDLRTLYYRVPHRRGKARAKLGVARALLVRLYIMRRDQIDYAEFRRHGDAHAA
jgi:transposase